MISNDAHVTANLSGTMEHRLKDTYVTNLIPILEFLVNKG